LYPKEKTDRNTDRKRPSLAQVKNKILFTCK
jgi:hypothetical protein